MEFCTIRAIREISVKGQVTPTEFGVGGVRKHANVEILVRAVNEFGSGDVGLTSISIRGEPSRRQYLSASWLKQERRLGKKPVRPYLASSPR